MGQTIIDAAIAGGIVLGGVLLIVAEVAGLVKQRHARRAERRFNAYLRKGDEEAA